MEALQTPARFLADKNCKSISWAQVSISCGPAMCKMKEKKILWEEGVERSIPSQGPGIVVSGMDNNITFRGLCVTHKTGSGLDLLTRNTFTHFRAIGNYSAIAVLYTLRFIITHALRFSVFTSRILVTDSSQSHSNFKSQIKTSSHSLIPFLPFLLDHLRLPSPELSQLLATNCTLGTSRCIAYGRTPRNTSYSVGSCCFRRVY
jgi:hypothetical protein